MKIFAVGMNHALHNKAKCGTLYNTEAPVIFLKADSSLLKPGKPFFVPDHLGRIEYEAEPVVRICRLGKNIPQRFAPRYYDALTLGIDFTARELLEQMRAQGLPWDMAKGFDGAACIGEWMPKEKFRDVQGIRFRLDKNGETVQQAYTGDMCHGVDELISYISRYYTLKTGDILYTGTPAGAGPVEPGDRLRGYLEAWPVLDLRCK